MLRLQIRQDDSADLKLLCLGSHCDDIEIGCGGTILSWIRERKNLVVQWVVFSSNAVREKEAQASANTFLRDAKKANVVIHNFRNSFFPYVGADIKECFERLRQEYCPDVILTHYRGDLHQDHRLIADLTWNTFRDHVILEYEVAKYDGDLGSPNVFVHLDEATCRAKIDYILGHFKSQEDNHWFSEDTFLALMRLRGIESNAPSKYAEAFYCRKLLLS